MLEKPFQLLNVNIQSTIINHPQNLMIKGGKGKITPKNELKIH